MFGSFRKLREYGIHMVEKYHDACIGSEAIIYHPGLAIGYFMAERLGIPAILASPFPLHKTSVRLSVILYGKAAPNAFLNRLSHTMLQGMLWMASESSLKPFWKNKYQRLPKKFGMPFERHGDGRNPAIVSCSNHIFERPQDWNPHAHQKGYWTVQESEEYQPSSELAAFLAAGEKPVYIGFGSMLDKGDAEKVRILAIEALTRAGKRGILCGMDSPEGLPDHCFAVGNVPHTWLFPRMAAVCHHGGAGTSAAGFLAGVPSVIVPFALDQFAWAQRSYDVGIGSKPLPFKKLSAARLAEAILFGLSREVRTKAMAIGRLIAAEQGARECALVVARAMKIQSDGNNGNLA
jgi:sterol 3beta-glucosyltransferase